MKQVTITGFKPTFNIDHFGAMHTRFTGKIIRGEISIDDAVAHACSPTYDPPTVYNTLQPHLATRNADRRVLALRVGSYVVGGIAGLVAPYIITDDPHGLVVCGSAVIGALAIGLPTLAFTDAPHDSIPEYDLAYDHIGAVVAALQEKYKVHKPLAEELVPGDGSYKVLRSRRIEPGTGFVESTVRYSLSDSKQSVDLFVVNGVPERIRVGETTPKGDTKTHKDMRTPCRFDSAEIGIISFPEATLQKYQEAIQQYGRLTVQNY